VGNKLKVSPEIKNRVSLEISPGDIQDPESDLALEDRFWK
jgi:hypothetical protein